MRTMTCRRCGLEEIAAPRGPLATVCGVCKRGRLKLPVAARGVDPRSPGYALALQVTELRLAVEQARAALRMGKPKLALAVLELHEAPNRSGRKAARKRAA